MDLTVDRRSSTHKPRDEIFVVIRHDRFATPGSEHEYTVKEAVWSEELASAEVERLSRVNAAKDVRYFYRRTRLYPPGTSAGPSFAADSQARAAAVDGDSTPSSPAR